MRKGEGEEKGKRNSRGGKMRWRKMGRGAGPVVAICRTRNGK